MEGVVVEGKEKAAVDTIGHEHTDHLGHVVIENISPFKEEQQPLIDSHLLNTLHL